MRWLSMDVYGYVRMCMDVYGCVWTCVSESGRDQEVGNGLEWIGSFRFDLDRINQIGLN
jgi:hypothetical protein